jgi:hypothetical protein
MTQRQTGDSGTEGSVLPVERIDAIEKDARAWHDLGPWDDGSPRVSMIKSADLLSLIAEVRAWRDWNAKAAAAAAEIEENERAAEQAEQERRDRLDDAYVKEMEAAMLLIEDRDV